MSITDQGCPVWCTGEHDSPGPALGGYVGGYFHDNTRDMLETVTDGEPWFVGVSVYVTPSGDECSAHIDLQGKGHLTPSEARQLADMLYVSAEIATSHGQRD